MNRTSIPDLSDVQKKRLNYHMRNAAWELGRPFGEGVAAAMFGGAYSDCPHEPGSLAAQLWQAAYAAWMDAVRRALA